MARSGRMSLRRMWIVGCAAFNLIPGTLLGFFNPSEEMLSIGTVALRVKEMMGTMPLFRPKTGMKMKLWSLK